MKKTKIMGILNNTPDSFSDGGKHKNLESALKHAQKMIDDGADIIDVGGESTRPGSNPITLKTEQQRVLPIIKLLAKKDIDISIDTYHPETAELALQAGANMINDVTGLNEEMLKIAKKYGTPAVMMHMLGKPKTMQEKISYNDVVKDIIKYFKPKIQLADEIGVKVIIDPGIGFGKTTKHNLEIIKRLKEFKALKKEIMIGPSRKNFIGEITGETMDNRVPGTLASITAAILNGADIIRVHDVKECVQAAKIADQLK